MTTSAADDMVDVARRTSWKAILMSIPWFLFSIPTVGGGASIIIFYATAGIKAPDQFMPWFAAALLLFGFLLLAAGIRRIRWAFEGGLYFRASSSGVAFRIPGRARWKTLLLATEYWERAYSWDQISTWYPYVYTINFIPSESSIRFEFKQGGWIAVPTYLFAGNRKGIAAAITAAAKD